VPCFDGGYAEQDWAKKRLGAYLRELVFVWWTGMVWIQAPWKDSMNILSVLESKNTIWDFSLWIFREVYSEHVYRNNSSWGRFFRCIMPGDRNGESGILHRGSSWKSERGNWTVSGRVSPLTHIPKSDYHLWGRTRCQPLNRYREQRQ